MNRIVFHGWLLESDDVATRAAYASLSTRSRRRCDCLPCRNFDAAKAGVFPPEARELFEQLGIDPVQEAEVYHNAPLPSGQHSYGGWWHFVGSIVTDTGTWVRLGPSFALWFRSGGALAPEAFRGRALVQCEFEADVPWVLEQPFGG